MRPNSLITRTLELSCSVLRGDSWSHLQLRAKGCLLFNLPQDLFLGPSHLRPSDPGIWWGLTRFRAAGSKNPQIPSLLQDRKGHFPGLRGGRVCARAHACARVPVCTWTRVHVHRHRCVYTCMDACVRVYLCALLGGPVLYVS